MLTRNVAGAVWISVIAALSVVGLSGCVGVLGGYQHEDMRDSRYREIIQLKADELADSHRPREQATAAEFYGSIGELESMDTAITKYFRKEPVLGFYLMMRGEQIHKFYGSSSGR